MKTAERGAWSMVVQSVESKKRALAAKPQLPTANDEGRDLHSVLWNSVVSSLRFGLWRVPTTRARVLRLSRTLSIVPSSPDTRVSKHQT